VVLNGTSYIAVAPVPAGGSPPPSSSWQTLAQEGTAGATGATGPQGPQGATGPQGPQGSTGPQGPAGKVTLPFSGIGDSSGTAFSVSNISPGASGIYGGGATSLSSGCTLVCIGGVGVQGFGGGSNGGSSFGGDGVFGIGGAPEYGGDYGGTGGYFVGGGSASLAVGGGDGVAGAGGQSVDGGAAGNGVVGTAGLGLTDGRTYGLAGLFSGGVYVNGSLAKAGGSFVIDHPTDPANKYLYHSFVESPDMMNIYNGNVVTDSIGAASVALPDWFEALNRDFRYQLTVIGQFAQAIVASEISNGRFTIKTDKPNVKVSWQVTGVRQDAWANAHRIPLEVPKSPMDQGHYLHPELLGHEGEPNITELRRAQRRPPTGQ
jgi:hypothetical protein